MPKLEEYAEKFDIKNMIITMILGALGFLLALQYRDVIKETIEFYMPAGEGLLYKWIITIVLTIIVIIVVYILIKIKKADIIPDVFEEKIKKRGIKKWKIYSKKKK